MSGKPPDGCVLIEDTSPAVATMQFVKLNQQHGEVVRATISKQGGLELRNAMDVGLYFQTPRIQTRSGPASTAAFKILSTAGFTRSVGVGGRSLRAMLQLNDSTYDQLMFTKYPGGIIAVTYY